jgi:hypothetical protein
MACSLSTLAPRLLGAWTTEARHTFLPGVVISGTSSVELLGLDGFLLHRTWYDHPDVPDAVSLLRGEQLHYFDERGVIRLFALTVTAHGWSVERSKTDDDFGQRMTWLVDAAGTTVRGRSQLSHDGVRWEDDLQVTYRRVDDGDDRTSLP